MRVLKFSGNARTVPQYFLRQFLAIRGLNYLPGAQRTAQLDAHRQRVGRIFSRKEEFACNFSARDAKFGLLHLSAVEVRHHTDGINGAVPLDCVAKHLCHSNRQSVQRRFPGYPGHHHGRLLQSPRDCHLYVISHPLSKPESRHMRIYPEPKHTSDVANGRHTCHSNRHWRQHHDCVRAHRTPKVPGRHALGIDL